jgi:trehalose 6-phosphate phosphatase
VSPAVTRVEERLAGARRLWLFLDYDGTLAELAPTPEHVEPDPEVVELLAHLAQESRMRVAVVSGRRLAHVQRLVPVPGILLAGTYGVEIETPEGERIDRLDYGAIRPVLDELKPRWKALVAGRSGFYLEDKGWSLALHARYAGEAEAAEVLRRARDEVRAAVDLEDGPFRLLGGDRFLEIGPRLAHKGRTVAYLLERYPWPGALPVYLGDDDKDEEAFGVVQARGGIAIVVGDRGGTSGADLRLASPRVARAWLGALNR